MNINVSKGEKILTVDNVKYAFVQREDGKNLPTSCSRCAFETRAELRYEGSVCSKVPCTPWRRKDGKDGFFRNKDDLRLGKIRQSLIDAGFKISNLGPLEYKRHGTQ